MELVAREKLAAASINMMTVDRLALEMVCNSSIHYETSFLCQTIGMSSSLSDVAIDAKFMNFGLTNEDVVGSMNVDGVVTGAIDSGNSSSSSSQDSSYTLPETPFLANVYLDENLYVDVSDSFLCVTPFFDTIAAIFNIDLPYPVSQILGMHSIAVSEEEMRFVNGLPALFATTGLLLPYLLEQEGGSVTYEPSLLGECSLEGSVGFSSLFTLFSGIVEVALNIQNSDLLDSLSSIFENNISQYFDGEITIGLSWDENAIHSLSFAMSGAATEELGINFDADFSMEMELGYEFDDSEITILTDEEKAQYSSI